MFSWHGACVSIRRKARIDGKRKGPREAMNGTAEAISSQGATLQPRRALENVGIEKDREEETRRLSHPGFQPFGADGFTFLDFLDIINPLQHIPIVNTLYRQATGDEIDPASRVAGSTLFGGPVGTVAAMASIAVEEKTGKDIGEHVLAALGFDGFDGFGGDDEEAPVLADGAGGTALETAAAGLEGTGLYGAAIDDNIEVLQWARREAALLAGPPAPAAGVVPPAPGAAGRAALNAANVAVNIEVLHWARREAAEARAQVQKAAALEDDGERQAEASREIDIESAARKVAAAGTSQDHLAGAAAPLGGWFSETMLLALSRYEQSAGLGDNGRRGQHLKAVAVDISE